MGQHLTGEYWIDDTNHLVFADGDVGDDNHESYALRTAQSKVSDALGLDDEEVESEGFMKVLRAHLDEEMPGWERLHREPNIAALRMCENDNRDISMLEMNTACELVKDARDVAIKEWGWISVRRGNIVMWEADKPRMEKLYRAIGDAFFEEGTDLTPEMEAETDLEIWVQKTQKTIYTTLADLKDQGAIQHADIPRLDAHKIAVNQLKTMDRDAMHPAYRRNLGD
jgi:hypothetical protein